MGHSQDEKTRSHDRIVAIASVRIREAGPDAPGVAEIMRAAGLTHGGFYKHFDSRDDLVAAAIDRALGDSERAMGSLTEGAADPLAAFVDWYTSDRHRADPANGCALVALGGDVSRTGHDVRAAYGAQVERYLGHLVELLPARNAEGDEPTDRRAAVTALSALVGGVLLARAVDDAELSAEILGDVAKSVTSQTFSSTG